MSVKQLVWGFAPFIALGFGYLVGALTRPRVPGRVVYVNPVALRSPRREHVGSQRPDTEPDHN